MERRSISKVFLALLVIPLVLLLAGVLWFTTYDPFKSLMADQSDPSTTLFVDQNAPLSLSLTVNPDRLLSLSPTPLKFGQSKTQAELENLRDSLLGIDDYETKVKPWLGDEMTLAVTSRDVDRTLQDGRQPGYLWVLKTQDAEASRTFLRSFWRQRSSVATNTELYEGSEITYGQVKNSIPQFSDVPFTLASAIVGNQYVLFGNSPKVLKNAINNVQASDLSLQRNPQYQKALSSIDANRLGVLYLNLPEFTALMGNDSIVKTLAQLPDESPVNYSTIAMALKGSTSGLVLDTALIPELGFTTVQPAAPALVQSAAEPIKPLEVVNLLPAESMAIAVGENLAEVWPEIDRTVKGYPALTAFQQQSLKSLESQSQLNLIQDVFAWVKGEYGLAIEAPNKQKASDWVFAVKRDGSDVQQGLVKLDQIARDRGLNIGPVKLGEQTVQAWTQLNSADNSDVLSAKTIAAHTTIGNYEVFSTSLDTLSKLANQSEKTMSQDKLWARSIQNIELPNQGYLYTDWQNVKPLIEQKVPGLKFLEILAQPVLSHLQGLTLSASSASGDVSRGTIVVGLK